MSRFNHGVEFQSVNTQSRVSFSDVVVDVNPDRNDSLDEERSSYDIHRTSQERRKTLLCRRICCGTIATIAVLVTFILLIMFSSRNLSTDSLTARVTFHNHHHRTIEDQCEESRYGCCEVYDSCQDLGYETVNHSSLRIWPSVQMKHNRLGTNCPRLNQIVHKYSEAYYPEENNHYHCKNSTFGCCSIDISCDAYVYIDKFVNENISHPYNDEEIIRYLEKEKIDAEGSNCPSIDKIVYAYNMGLNNSLDILILLFIIGALVSAVYGLMTNCG